MFNQATTLNYLNNTVNAQSVSKELAIISDDVKRELASLGSCHVFVGDSNIPAACSVTQGTPVVVRRLLM